MIWRRWRCGPRSSRAGVEPGAIDDVYLGCANQAGEDNRDVARMAVLLAGLPQSVPGVTLNRLCASGLAAVVSACHAVIAGDGDLFVAGGVESMTRAPLSMPKPARAFERGHRTVYDTTLGWRYPNPRLEAMFPLESMGETGENVAERYDDLAGRSGRVCRALAAKLGGGAGGWPVRRRADRDRASSTATSTRGRTRPPPGWPTLKPAFRAGGSVTAGNSSGMNDGAAALVIASDERAAALGVEPLATFRGSAAAGVDPRVMGIGPIPAVRKAARAHRREHRPDRPGGAERGVCLAERRGGARAGHRPRPGQRQRRRDRAGPSAGHERRPAGGVAGARAAPA